MDMGRDRMDRGESTGDWRSGPRTEVSNGDRRGGFNRDREGGGFNREGMRGEREERSFNRDNMRGEREERSFSRDNMRGTDRDDKGYSRDRDGGYNRDRDNKDGFRRDKDGSDDKPGGWREGERFNKDDRGEYLHLKSLVPVTTAHTISFAGFSRERGGYRDSERTSRFDDRDDRKGFGRRFDDRDKNGRGGDRFQETARCK